jgi:16S rRNA (uracil1498-N3)-methyltransferase
LADKVCVDFLKSTYLPVMQIFYVPHISGGLFSLEKDESRHLLKVLRKQVGDEVVVTDGRGGRYQCKILIGDLKKCQLEVLSKDLIPEPTPRLSIAIAPTKSMDRLEWFVEKATEIGVHAIHPVRCKNSERTTLKIDRLNRVAVAAMKQSIRFRVPAIHQLVTFNELLESRFEDDKFLAHLGPEARPLSASLDKQKDTLIMVGPEGDFTEDELRLAQKADFRQVTLGQSRLRTETAGVVAATAFNLLQTINE